MRGFYKLQKLYDDGSSILWDIAKNHELKEKSDIFQPQVISKISPAEYNRLERFIQRCEGPCIEKIIKEIGKNENKK